MPTFEDARRIILDHAAPLESERVGLLNAAGRAIAEDISAPWDMPLWDNSAMDGFAVRAGDCPEGATLKIIGYIPAGGSAAGLEVTAGTAIKIMTGAPVPAGCDAIVPIEEVIEESDTVRITGKVEGGDHIRVQGADIAAGDLVIPAGTTLRPPEVNLLASFGKPFVSVHRRVRVAILSTGDELVELGDPLTPERIINSNALSLAAAVKDIGAEPVLLGIARDNRESHLEKLRSGLKADVLITSAGVSAGDRDLVREMLDELGVKPVFWKIDMKPGGPTAFLMNGDRPVFCLPGNPVSTMITFEELVRPALLKMMGHSKIIKPFVKATLTERVRKKSGRVHFLRVAVTAAEQGWEVSSSGDQNTGILRTMVRANGIALLPADRDVFEAGEQVNVHLLSAEMFEN